MVVDSAKQVKQLAELLQEQQDPFILQVYLSEKSCHGRKSSSHDWSMDSRGRKGPKSIARVSKLLRALYNKVAFIHARAKHCESNSSNNEDITDVEEVLDLPTTDNLYYEADKNRASTQLNKELQREDVKEMNQAVAGRNVQPRARNEDFGQLDNKTEQRDLLPCPTRQEESESTCRAILPKKITEDSSSSPTTSALEILFHSGKDKQTRQLLFDCVKEVMEVHGRKEKARENKRVPLGPEELGKLICEKIVTLARTSGNETTIDELLYMDYLDSQEEWEHCVTQKMHISLQIEDAIMEDIYNDLTLEMMCNS